MNKNSDESIGLESRPSAVIGGYKQYSFALEPLTDVLWQEFIVLDSQRFAEMREFHGSESYNPDKERRQQMNKLGQSVFFAIRNAGVLVGYGLGIRHKTLNGQDWVMTDDVLYFAPIAREGGLFVAFVQYLEDFARSAGIKRVRMNVWKDSKALGPLTMILGYKHQATVVEKEL